MRRLLSTPTSKSHGPGLQRNGKGWPEGLMQLVSRHSNPKPKSGPDEHAAAQGHG
jgi:hypothetical protein